MGGFESFETPKNLADNHRGTEGLPVTAIVPGLFFILFVDIAAVLDADHLFEPFFRAWALIVALLPWITLILLRKTPAIFGYTRRRALAIFGWGMVAGAVWRALSLGFNTCMQHGWTDIGSSGLLFFGLVFWIPFLEETFFRAYIGGSLLRRFGRWPSVLIQAILFSFHPGHWRQGWLHIVSIFAFGILAGWLYARFRSIWAPWGAHAFANVLPLLLRGWIG